MGEFTRDEKPRLAPAIRDTGKLPADFSRINTIYFEKVISFPDQIAPTELTAISLSDFYIVYSSHFSGFSKLIIHSLTDINIKYYRY